MTSSFAGQVLANTLGSLAAAGIIYLGATAAGYIEFSEELAWTIAAYFLGLIAAATIGLMSHAEGRRLGEQIAKDRSAREDRAKRRRPA